MILLRVRKTDRQVWHLTADGQQTLCRRQSEPWRFSVDEDDPIFSWQGGEWRNGCEHCSLFLWRRRQKQVKGERDAG